MFGIQSVLVYIDSSTLDLYSVFGLQSVLVYIDSSTLDLYSMFGLQSVLVYIDSSTLDLYSIFGLQSVLVYIDSSTLDLHEASIVYDRQHGRSRLRVFSTCFTIFRGIISFILFDQQMDIAIVVLRRKSEFLNQPFVGRGTWWGACIVPWYS